MRAALGVLIILAIVYVIALIASGGRPLEALKFSGMMVFDTEPDALGRRRFALQWKASVPRMRGLREVGRVPGIRAQHFHARPERFFPGGPR